MVAWDLGMDPTSSTIRHLWIWEQGGGYFGVPLTNYLGWFFTVYVFFQVHRLLRYGYSLLYSGTALTKVQDWAQI